MHIEQNMEINLLMMKINPEILKFAKVFILLDLCLLIYSFSFQNGIWLLNTQVAFISSLFIVIASFYSYKRNIQNRLSNLDLSKQNQGEQRDKIDEIDDPYDLYTEYEQVPESELTPEKIKEIIEDGYNGYLYEFNIAKTSKLISKIIDEKKILKKDLLKESVKKYSWIKRADLVSEWIIEND